MPALKRTRQPLYDADEEEEEDIIDVDSARSEVRQDNVESPLCVLVDLDTDSFVAKEA